MFKPVSFTNRDVPASETETVYVEGRLPGERVSKRRTFAQLEKERRRQGLEKELFYKPSPFSDSLPTYPSSSPITSPASGSPPSSPSPSSSSSYFYSPSYSYSSSPSPAYPPSSAPSLKPAKLPPLPDNLETLEILETPEDSDNSEISERPDSLTRSVWDTLEDDGKRGESEVEKDGEELAESEGNDEEKDELESYDIDPLQQDFGDEDNVVRTEPPPASPTKEEEDDLELFGQEGDITEDSTFGLSTPRYALPLYLRSSKIARPTAVSDKNLAAQLDTYYSSSSQNISSTDTYNYTTSNNNDITAEDPMSDISEDEFEVDPFEGEDINYTDSAATFISPPISPPISPLSSSDSYTTPIPPPTVFSSTTLEAEAEAEVDEMDQQEIDKLDEMDASDDEDGDDDGPIEDGSEFLEDTNENFEGEVDEFSYDDPESELEFEPTPHLSRKSKK